MIWTTTAVDHPRQPGAQPEPRARLRAGRHRARPADAGRARWSRSAWSATASRARCSPPSRARSSAACEFQHPLYDVDPGYDRLSPVYLADYATADDGTGIVHSSPAYGVDDFNSCVAHGLAYDDILNPVQGNGVYAPDFPLFGGQNIWKAVPRDHRRAARRRPPARHRDHHPQLPALLAPQDAGDLPRRGAVVHPHGREARACSPRTRRRKTLRQMRARRDRADQLLSRERQGAPARHDRQPARLVHQPPAQLGRAAARSSCTRTRASCIRDTMEILDQAADIVEQGGIEAWSRVDAPKRSSAPDRRAALHQEHRHPRGLVRLGLDLLPRAARQHPDDQPRDDGPEADLYLEGHDQHRGWFHSSLLIACAMEGRAPYRGLLTHGFTVDSQGRKMSKSLGNGIDPQEVTKKLGAEIIRLWVRRHRLLGRHRRRRQDPGARGRRLPPHPQHAALPAGQHQRLRRRDATRCRSAEMLEIDRYALAPRGAVRRPTIAGALQGLRVPPGGRQAAGVLLRRPGRVLPRHPEGPALHHGAEVAGAAQRADRAVAHHPRDAALDGAVPELHRRGGVEGVRAERPTSIFIETYSDARRGPTRRCWPSGRASARSATRSTRRSRRCAPTARSARRCRPTWRSSADADDHAAARQRWATT